MTPAIKLGLTTLPLFVAESTTDSVKSSALGEWLVIGAAVLVIAQIGWSFVDRVRGGSPQKREVSFTEQFVTREQHVKLEEEIAKIDNERRVSVAGIHSKIDNLAERLDDRIDNVPERTIALLKNTKGLIS
ncbi:MAG: hypothetical protein HY302_09335 [Opitutae bacterium]|nr:hypothetical protein [Opitutae bacterium]